MTVEGPTLGQVHSTPVLEAVPSTALQEEWQVNWQHTLQLSFPAGLALEGALQLQVLLII